MPSSVLQIIAMITMAIDHASYIYTYGNASTTFLNYIGRLAFPIFCFQAAIGYKKTKDLKKYMLRMIAIAIISQLPYFLFFDKVELEPAGLNVIFTLIFGLIAIFIYDFTIEDKKIKINTGLSIGEKYSKLPILTMTLLFIVKIVGISLICYLANVVNSEYGIMGVLLVLGMYALYPFKEEKISTSLKVSKIVMYFILAGGFAYFEARTYINAVSLGYMQYLDEAIGLMVGVIIGCTIPFLYNGEKGRKLKYIGYIFYPLQFIIIVIINMLIH